jgi:hypothetical protein
LKSIFLTTPLWVWLFLTMKSQTLIMVSCNSSFRSAQTWGKWSPKSSNFYHDLNPPKNITYWSDAIFVIFEFIYDLSMI